MKHFKDSQHGTSLLELMFAMAIVATISAIALPATKNVLKSYHLSAAVKSATGGIQSTRYLALMRGYHYNITFDPTTQTYQIASKVPPAITFSNVGGPVPWSVTNDVTMTPATTLEFYPGGTVVATTGALTFTMTNGVTTETVTISGVGNVDVSP